MTNRRETDFQDADIRVERMNLSRLLDGVRVTKMFQTLYGQMVTTHDIEVRGVQYDSRKVARGDLFVAIRGAGGLDGHAYITGAIRNGAVVVVLEDDAALADAYFMHTGVAKVVVPNTRAALARIAENFYESPARRLTLVGVTGTNGKTTTTHLIRQVMEQHQQPSSVGLIGTIEYIVGGEPVPATHTTPESLELNELLAKMVERRCTAAVMEVSSHALDQHRVDGMPFHVAVFTNLTQDHLDYHGSMEKYFEAKKILFERLAPESWAVVNLDDPYGARLRESTRAQTLSYGIDAAAADVRATGVSLSMQETRMTVLHGREETPVASSLIGRFNVSNILAAFSAGVALGIPKSAIRQAIGSMKSVRGRFEPVVSPRGWTAVIDYAHTPDALEKTLEAIRTVLGKDAGRRIITVFGCGGDRDRTKRPQMGAIAARISDVTFITSDNPRSEDPGLIIAEVRAGIDAVAAAPPAGGGPGIDVRTETDRRTAIFGALALALPGDVVLIAGKGHEEYQIIGETKIHFNDREVVEEFIASQPS